MSALSPGFVLNQVPTPDEWNSYFAGKLDNIFASAAVAEAGTDTTLPINSAVLAAAFAYFLNNYLANLPTTEPGTPGQFWWDGGTLAKS